MVVLHDDLSLTIFPVTHSSLHAERHPATFDLALIDNNAAVNGKARCQQPA
jgi:hypothetical protein